MGPVFVKRKTLSTAKKRASEPQNGIDNLELKRSKFEACMDAKSKPQAEPKGELETPSKTEHKAVQKSESTPPHSKPERVSSKELSHPNVVQPKDVAFDPAQIIRQSHRFDFQKDICKEYYQKGRCRYGDNCKFLHERRDSAKNHNVKKETPEIQGCPCCRSDPPEDPVLPKCGHELCEACFLKEIKRAKASKCRICSKELGSSARPKPVESV